MKWFKKLFTKEPPINPEDWGWVEQVPRWNNRPHYILNDYVLYKSMTDSWVFDCMSKKSPGIIARFDNPLLDADLDYMREYIKRVR